MKIEVHSSFATDSKFQELQYMEINKIISLGLINNTYEQFYKNISVFNYFIIEGVDPVRVFLKSKEKKSNLTLTIYETSKI